MSNIKNFPQCDCINSCGDDDRVGQGAAQPCSAYHKMLASKADHEAVRSLSCAMMSKLQDSRSKGRSGWNDKTQCSAEHLSQLLREHVEKGDPVDVANFCAFLSARGEGIAPQTAPAVVALPIGWVQLSEQDRAGMLQKIRDWSPALHPENGYMITPEGAIFAFEKFLREKASAALAAPPAAAPAGWKLVPTEPTPQMCHVGRYGGSKDAPAYGEKPVEGETAWPFVADHTAEQIYRAMLSAAPALAATPAAAAPVVTTIPDAAYCALQYVEHALAAIANREELVEGTIERVDTIGKASKRAKAALTRLQAVAHHFNALEESPAAAAPQHQGMTIAGNGAAELGKLMREQWETRGGVYPDGNPNAGQP